MGAIASGVCAIDEDVLRSLDISAKVIHGVAAEELLDLERREQSYRGGRAAQRIADRVAIVVDDRMATGSSIRAAISALRRHRPAQIVVAIPVVPGLACEESRADIEKHVCLIEAEEFFSVGRWYQNFQQVSDQEVREILVRASELGRVATY
jgi:putative phosphoribosyl transferase